jgi:acetoin utilization protein AcuB
MMNEAISTIMTKNPISLVPHDTLDMVKSIFAKYRIHHLPVVDGRKLVGILTTYDMWKLNTTFDQYSTIKVEDVMNKKIAVVEAEDKIGTAAELFLDNRFHALPVVENGNLVGIVTSFDVLKYEFLKEYPNPILYKEVFTSSGLMRATA